MINKALDFYNFDISNVELIRHNENMTYKVTDSEKSYVLRIHKPSEGFNVDLLHTDRDKTDLIIGEVELLQQLFARGNSQTQKVKLNIYGNPVTILNDESSVTVLEWIEGITLDNVNINAETAFKLGVMIGEMHNVLAYCSVKNRFYYNGTLLSKMINEASNALMQGHFNEQQANTIIDTLSYIRDYLTEENERFMIVHADLGKSNLIYNNDTIIPIDFSLSGYCIPEMDLASAFTHINDAALNREILNGYKSICDFNIENKGIDVCFCLQILLFIITQHNKFAGESWFKDRLNVWCESHFAPLLAKNAD